MAALVVLTAAVGVNGSYTSSQFGANGPVYRLIRRDQELGTGLASPRQFILDAYFTAQSLVNAAEEDNRARVPDLVNQLKLQEEDYTNRTFYWRNQFAAFPLVSDFDAARKPAVVAFSAIDDKIIPAVQARNARAAREALQSEATPAFDEHRKWIEQLLATLEYKQLL